MKKWIHLTGLEGNTPLIGIEGLTDYEAILWLQEAIRVIKKRKVIQDMQEYEERAHG